MQLNENAVVFESADAGYAACTGPAAAATGAAGPTRGGGGGGPGAGESEDTARETFLDLLRRGMSGWRSGAAAGEEASAGSLPACHARPPIDRLCGSGGPPAGGLGRRCAAPAGGPTRATLRPVTTPPRGREAGEIPAQSPYGDRRSRNGGSPVAGPAAEPHVPSRERGRQA